MEFWNGVSHVIISKTGDTRSIANNSELVFDFRDDVSNMNVSKRGHI